MPLWLEAAERGTAVTRTGTPYRAERLESYRRMFERFVVPALGEKRITEITRGDVVGLIGVIQRKGLAPSSVRNAIIPLRSLYRWALDNDMVAYNPTVGVRMPGVSNSRRSRYTEPDEIKTLLAALNERDRVLWATAFYAGLRRGELAGLRWSDVDLENRELRVERAWSWVSREVIATKTATGRRTIPITALLHTLMIEHDARRRVKGRRRSDNDLVFSRASLIGPGSLRKCDPDKAELPFNSEGLVDRARRAWKAAGVESVTLHECRHACASNALAAGVKIPVVQRLLGHTSIHTTVNIYGHLGSNATEDARDLLDAFLGG